MRRVYIALGANLGDRERTIERAISEIGRRIGQPIAKSRLYRSRPLTRETDVSEGHPEYLNGVLVCSSAEEPAQILDKLLEIERSLGRVRESEARWQPRKIDLDLLAVGNFVIDTERLKLPHPEMHKRDFVLVPLREADGGFVHPVLKIGIGELIARLGEQEYILEAI